MMSSSGVILMLEEFSQNSAEDDWETPYVFSVSVVCVLGWIGSRHIPDRRQNTAFVYIRDFT
jgi:hypothetical protein